MIAQAAPSGILAYAGSGAMLVSFLKTMRMAGMNEIARIRPDSELAAEFWGKGHSESCPVYDMHGHMGEWRGIYFPRPEAADMVRSMDSAGVKMLCFAHHAAMASPDIGNAPAVAAVRAFPDRLRAYLAVNPHYPDLLKRDLSEFDDMRDVFAGMKFHPTWHGVPLTDVRYEAALAFADERSLPVLVHAGASSPVTGPDLACRLAEQYGKVRFLLAHCFYDWDAAIRVAREHPNTYLDLTGVLGLRGLLELLCDGVGSERVLFGTDLPWFDPHHGIGALLSSTIAEEDIHNICHRNAEKLLGV